jgi:predicted nucleotidyltransferase
MLQSAEIKFVLIGGLAMRVHGSSHVTGDVDVVYAEDSENLQRLAIFLRTIHARVLGRPANDNFLITAQTLARVRFLNLHTDLGEMDFMREIPGVDSFDGLWTRAIEIDLEGFVVRVACIDDIISMKRVANRTKDQSHIVELLALKQLSEN